MGKESKDTKKEDLRLCMESNANKGKHLVKVLKTQIDGMTDAFKDEIAGNDGYIKVDPRKVAAALA